MDDDGPRGREGRDWETLSQVLSSEEYVREAVLGPFGWTGTLGGVYRRRKGECTSLVLSQEERGVSGRHKEKPRDGE